MAYNVPAIFNHVDNKIQASHHKPGSRMPPGPSLLAPLSPSFSCLITPLSHSGEHNRTPPSGSSHLPVWLPETLLLHNFAWRPSSLSQRLGIKSHLPPQAFPQTHPNQHPILSAITPLLLVSLPWNLRPVKAGTLTRPHPRVPGPTTNSTPHTTGRHQVSVE